MQTELEAKLLDAEQANRLLRDDLAQMKAWAEKAEGDFAEVWAERNGWQARAEIAERRVAELERQLAAKAVGREMRLWNDNIDPRSIPDEVLRAERARRNSAKRKTHGAGTGRPRIMRRCPKCEAEMSATELRRHKCGGES